MDVIKPILNFLWDILFFITGEGSWNLRSHERIVLEAVIDQLDTPAQGILRSLLRQKMFIERANSRVVRPRFYTAHYARLRMPIEYLGDEIKAYEVVIDVAGHNQRAHAVLFRGNIDSIQLASSKDFYNGKIVRALKVSEIDPRFTIAGEIDREEHGEFAMYERE